VPDGRSQWKSFALLLQNNSLVLESDGKILVSYSSFNGCPVDKLTVERMTRSTFIMEEICKCLIIVPILLENSNDALLTKFNCRADSAIGI
jgi:hypothetical protein